MQLSYILSKKKTVFDTHDIDIKGSLCFQRKKDKKLIHKSFILMDEIIIQIFKYYIGSSTEGNVHRKYFHHLHIMIIFIYFKQSKPFIVDSFINTYIGSDVFITNFIEEYVI